MSVIISDFMPAEIMGTADAQVPKACTSIHIAKLSNSNFLLSFIYEDKEKNEKNEIETVSAVLIGRVIVDKEHVERLVEKLSEVLKA